MYLGDIRLGDTIDCKFTSRRFTTGAPFTLAGSPVISAYVGNGTTQITAGITLTVDFDSVTGLNNVRVVASSGNGFATATNVQLVITTGTVDSVSVVGEVVGSFSIEARSAVMPTTAARTLAVDASGRALSDVDTIKTNPVVNAGTVTFPTTATLASTTNVTAGTLTTVTTATNVTTVNGLAANVITAASIAADAITDAKVAADVTIASVTGSVGSVTGSVGSVAGAVGSVTGAVGSVTGNVGGNVVGSVASVVGAVGSVTGLTAANLDATVSSRLASGSYTAPDNASVTAIKAKTDSLAFTVAGQVDSNVQYVNDVLVNGTGAPGNEWGP